MNGRREAVAFPGYAVAFFGLVLVLLVTGLAVDVISTAFTLASGFVDSLTPPVPSDRSTP